MQKKIQIQSCQIQYAKQLGRGEWSSSLLCEQEESIAKQRGNLYAIVSLQGRWGLKGETLVKEFLQNLKDYYYKNPESNVVSNFEQSVRFAHRKLSFELRGEENNNALLFNLVALVLWGNVMYLAQTGKAKAVLLRGENEEVVGGDDSENTLKEELFANAIHLGSGLIKKDDVLLLGLPNFWKQMEMEKLKTWLKNHPLEEAKTKTIEMLEEKNATLTQSLWFQFSVGIFPTEEEVIKINVPPAEEPKEWQKHLKDVWMALNTKVLELKKKPLKIVVKRNQSAASDGVSQVSDVEVNEFKKEVESKPILPPTEEVSQFTQGKQSFTLPKANWFSSVIGKVKVLWQKLVLRTSKKFMILSEQFKQAKGTKETPKEDPNKYLNKKWFLSFFAKKGFLVIIVLVLVFAGSVYLTSKLREKNTAKETAETLYEQMMKEMADAKRVSFRDTDRRAVYARAQEAWKTLESSKLLADKKKLFRDEMTLVRNAIYKIYITDNPTILADISLKNDQAQGKDLALFEGFLYVTDQKSSSMYRINETDGAIEKIDGPQGQKLQALVVTGQILYGMTDRAVFDFNENKNTWNEDFTKSDDWQKVIDLGAYYGNLYLLDGTAKQIWKYTSSNGVNFSNPIKYLTQAFTPSEPVSIAIDGTIFVLFSSGEVKNVVYGNPTDFSLHGLDTALSSPSFIGTTEQAKNLYVLDNGNRRVVVYDKSGAYQKQYTNDEWGALNGLAVNDTEKTLYVLNNNQILSIPLN